MRDPGSDHGEVQVVLWQRSNPVSAHQPGHRQGVSRHSEPAGRAGLAGLVLGLLAGLLAAWVALDVLAACCDPQAARTQPQPRGTSQDPTGFGAAIAQHIIWPCP